MPLNTESRWFKPHRLSWLSIPVMVLLIALVGGNLTVNAQEASDISLSEGNETVSETDAEGEKEKGTDSDAEESVAEADVSLNPENGESLPEEIVGDALRLADENPPRDEFGTGSETDGTIPGNAMKAPIGEDQEAGKPPAVSEADGPMERVTAYEATATGDKLTCRPGDFYAVTNTGRVYQVKAPAKGGRFTSATADKPTIDFSTLRSRNGGYYGGPNSQVNGLAVGGGGSIVYALDKSTWSRSNGTYNYYEATSIYKWENGVKTVEGTLVPNDIRDTGYNSSMFIAGGMQPTGSKHYYFGGYTIEAENTKEWVPGHWGRYIEPYWENEPVYGYDNYGRWAIVGYRKVQRGGYTPWIDGYWETKTTYRTKFNVWRYDGSGVQYLGYVSVDSSDTRPAVNPNGDIAFDDQGNMYILYHDGGENVRIVPVLKDSLTEAGDGLYGVDQTSNEYYEIPAQSVTTITVDAAGRQLNGLAFNYDGNILVQGSNLNVPATMSEVDPSTGQVIARTTLPTSNYGGWNFGTDLASCNSFPTIELKKDIKSRKNEEDQFKLEILRENADGSLTLDADAETVGQELGLQPEEAGPSPAVIGKRYRVRESGSISQGVEGRPADLSNYKTSLRCENTATGRELSLTKVTEHEWSFVAPGPTDEKMPKIDCVYTNEANVGAVKWHKTGETKNGSNRFLPGTVWELTAADGTSRSYRIEDCIDNAPDDGTDECAPRDGEITDIDPAEGGFYIANLPYGEYDLKEIETPEGYELPSEPLKRFTVSSSNEAAELDLGTFNNVLEEVLGEITWEKVGNPFAPSADTVINLAGSSWGLTPVEADGMEPRSDAETKVVEDCVADTPEECEGEIDADPAAGKFRVTELPEGWYQLVELEAPLGFRKEDTPHYLEINSSQLIATAGSIENKPIDTAVLPKTGGRGFLPTVLGGLGIVLYGLWLSRRERKSA